MKSSDNVASILYADNHMVIASKPSGWLTQPDENERDNLEDFVKAWVKREYNKPGAVFLHCIHRLDRPVSGLVLFARTSKALSRLNEMSRLGRIERRYVAEVEGVLPNKEGELEHFLIHGDHRAVVAPAGHEGAKRALLRYRVLAMREHTSLVEIELETGRYHQIRAQFGAVKHPIVADAKYGARQGKSEAAIHLACVELAFEHPVTKEPVKVQRPAPFA